MDTLFPGFAAAPWPRPADPAAASRERERFLAAAVALTPEESDAARAIAGSTPGRAALDAAFGNSPFLTHCVQRDPGFTLALLREGPDAAHARIATALASPEPADGADLMRRLRVARARTALAVALADIAGVWPLARVTAALSGFADAAIGLAVDDQLRAIAAAGAIDLADADAPARGSGLVVRAMGKLGGEELNYSSDVDLIVLFDPARVRTRDRDGLQKAFVRLVRGVVKLLEERTGDGYVLRTDLRLRPDPGATPLAISTDAAEFYYENMGQNWERAAMIKARPCAGDRAAGQAFLDAIRPYVWRRHLDFAAIQDIHSIKRQINAHRGGAEVAVAGHDIKVGRGGIREIEFFAQTLQLIFGGRDPSLRGRSTCATLDALVAAGRIDRESADDLIDAYGYLRGVEHRLQMTDDRQTQRLPAEPAALAALATFLGEPDAARFEARMLAVLRRVERRYAGLFEESPELGSGVGNLVFTGTDDDPDTLATLKSLGFSDPPAVAAQIRAWHHGRYRAMRSPRARELMTELMPGLLHALGATPNPDAAFIHFDRFLSRLPAGVQILSLFHANLELLGLVAEIMGGAPRLAEQLSQRPHLLDSVLSAAFAAAPPGPDALAADLAAALRQARDFQDVLDVVRRWQHEREFQVGVQLLRGRIDVPEAGRALSDLAEATLGVLKPAVEAEFARAHGSPPGGWLAVVALGKLGGRETTFTSDLDLVLIYDVPDTDAPSDGEKPLPPSHYYNRLAQRLVNAITALTPEGRLYEVDMRLRPSGAKGPIAVSLEGFRRYNETDAWTWEHMALTRARVVAGDAALGARVAAAIGEALARPRDPERLVADVAAMRARIAKERRDASPWDVKNRRGGLIDVEFAVQYLQLRHGATHPAILAPGTRDALDRVATAGLLAAADAAALRTAFELATTVQGVLRLAVEGIFDPAGAPPALLARLARAAGALDFAALEATLEAATRESLAVFERLIPPEAAAHGTVAPD